MADDAADPQINALIHQGEKLTRETKMRRREDGWKFNAWRVSQGLPEMDFAAMHAEADAAEARAAEAAKAAATIPMASLDDARTPAAGRTNAAARDVSEDDHEDQDADEEEEEQEVEVDDFGEDPLFGHVTTETFTLLPGLEANAEDRSTRVGTRRVTTETTAPEQPTARASARARKPPTRLE